MSELFKERFEESELIGQGAMGEVFRGQDPRLDRQVAIKLLRAERSEGKNSSDRFIAEAKITGRLEHPSIPPVYEYGETPDGRPFFALKLLDGQTLSEVIQKLKEGDPSSHSRFDFPQRVQIALRLAEAVNYAHSEQILHRDIKPDNIMLGPFGEVWLVDWGVAGPPTPETEEELTSDSSRMTEESTFLGTMSYAAPEQLAGNYSSASDQYSLGATLYEFFTLEPAHPGENRMEVMTSVLNQKPKAPEFFRNSHQGRVPREISVLLLRMLNKESDKRFPNLFGVIEQLKIVAGGDINAICPHTLTKKSFHRFGRVLDNHNYWLMPLLIIWFLYPLYALIKALVNSAQ